MPQDNEVRNSVITNDSGEYRVKYYYSKMMNCCGAGCMFDFSFFYTSGKAKHACFNRLRREIGSGVNENIDRDAVFVIAAQHQTDLHEFCKYAGFKVVHQWVNHRKTSRELTLYVLDRK